MEKEEREEDSKKEIVELALEYLKLSSESGAREEDLSELSAELKEKSDYSLEDPKDIVLEILRGYSRESFDIEDASLSQILLEVEGGGKKLVKSNLDFSLSGQVAEVARKLGLSEKTWKRAVSIFEKAERGDLMEAGDLNGYIAAAIYAASNETGDWRSQVEIAQAAGVSKSLLFKHYKELADGLGLDKDN